MKEQDPKERTFFQELLRRHVFSASAAYIVGAWVIIQVVDVLAPAFNAPEWTIRAITTVLILAFPLVVVLAWEFDTTRRGLKRTAGDRDRGLSARPWFRRSLVGLISLASLASIWWVWTSGVLTDQTFAEKDEDKFPKIVAVDDFKIFAGDESQWLGEGLANLVRDNLSQSEYLRVISLRRWRALSEGVDSEALFEVAAEAGIRYLVQGEIIGNRKGFVLTARLTDTADGEQLDAKTFEVEEASSLLDRATSVAQNARAILKVPVEERVDVFAADFAADNPSAYRAFVGALDYWINFEFSSAERLFRAALELEPDYAMARYYLAWVLAVQDRNDEALAVLGEAAETTGLSERNRAYIKALQAFLNRDPGAAVPAYEDLVQKYPSDTEVRHLLAESYDLQGNSEAALEVYRLLSQLEPEIHHGWSGLAYTHVMLGNFEQARPAIEKFRELAPDNPNVYVLRGDLNRAEGKLTDAARDYRIATEKGPELQYAVVSLGQVEYLSGNVDAALTTLGALVRDTTAVPRYRIEAAFAAGGILNGMGRFSEHVTYLDLITDALKASDLFYAKGLTDKALAKLYGEGPQPEVAALIDEALAAWQRVPTRYLFARGLVELASEDHAALEKTITEIRGHALPTDDPDRTEDMAADYLAGRAALARGDGAAALGFLEKAMSVDGYQYRAYALAHARALVATGASDKAVAVLKDLLKAPETMEPRLDLELDRQLAKLELALIYAERGERSASLKLVNELTVHWAEADPGFVAPEELRGITYP